MVLLRLVRPLIGPISTLVALACGGGDLVIPSDGGGGTGTGGAAGPSASRSAVSADPASIQLGTGVSTITVRVLDGTGAPVSGATVVLESPGSDNILTQPSGPTGSDGLATGTLSAAAVGTTVISATVNDTVRLRQTAAITVTAVPGMGTRLESVEGDAQTAPAGTPVTVRPAVRVTDERGDPVPGVAVSFTVTGGGGTVDGADGSTDADGVASAGDWTLGPALGTNTLEARAGTTSGSPVVFTAEGVSGTEVDHFVFRVQPHDVDEDESFSVEVAMVDAAGAVLPQSGIVIYLGLFADRNDGPSNDRLQGERFRETVAGVAVFDGLRISKKGNHYRLRALTDGLPGLGVPGPTPYLYSDPFDVR